MELDGIADLSRIAPLTEADVMSSQPARDLKAQFGGDALERLRRDEQRQEGGTVVIDADD